MAGVVRTIVVVEDEQPIAEAVAARLRSEGYRVEIADSGPAGVELVERLQPDLVVLDLMLPGLDGVEVCRRIQQQRWVPVLMLTARDSEADLVIGLGVGADDYLTKPFSVRELVARVSALMRRVERAAEGATRGSAGGEAGTYAGVFMVGDVIVDPARRRVVVGDEPVHLTPTEFDLFCFLARRPGHVSTRAELLARVWGYDFPAGARTVDSHVRSLRRKLGSNVVRTVHGVGYAVEETPQPGRAEVVS